MNHIIYVQVWKFDPEESDYDLSTSPALLYLESNRQSCPFLTTMEKASGKALGYIMT